MDGTTNPPVSHGAADRPQPSATSSHWGPFELRQRVGRGGFGEVYRAWDPNLQREVGLKILLPRPYQATAPYDEILREARALAAVRHPNILPVYGVDRHDGRVGFWTDFIHGKTLASLVREQGPFGYRETALIGLDVSRALSAVHRAGLLHRDIKAENVMREEGGRILLMDFGLSALAGHHPDSAGTPRYMAPELLRGGSATVATDIYALGVLLFFLVTGHHPDQPPVSASPSQAPAHGADLDPEAPTADTLPAITGAPASSSVTRSILDHRPDLPDAFVRIVETAIHPDPSRRFASAGAMSSALAETLGGSGDGSVSLPAPPPGKRRFAWAPGLAIAAVVLALSAWLASAGHRHGRHGPAAEAAPAGLNDQFLQADALLKRYDIHKNVTDAAGILNGILAKDPNFALAQAALGRAYFLEYRTTRTPGLLDQARTACNRAIAIDSSLARPYATLAWIDATAGHNDLAEQDVDQALRLDPRSAEAYGAQAKVLDVEGRTAEAITAIQKAADLEPDYWGWPVQLGNLDFGAGKLQDAADAYRDAAQIAPDNAIVWLNLGLVALQLNQYSQAETDLEKSVRIQPGFSAYSTLSEVLGSEGKFEQAVDASKKALDFDPSNYLAWGNLAANYLQIPADRDRAIETYRKSIQLAEAARKETPQDPLLLGELGDYYASVGDGARSIPLLRQAVALAPEDPNVLFAAGDGYEILHHRSDAIPLIVHSIALGFHSNELEDAPELASLRASPSFQKALHAALAKH